MARLILSCYPADSTSPGLLGVMIAQDGPIPNRVVEIKRANDAMREFESYKAEVAATGKPAAVSMRIARGDRSPPGFKALKGAANWQGVNV